MSADAVLAVVTEVVGEVVLGDPRLAPDTELLESGLLDSLGIVAVVSELERRYGVEFPPEALGPDTFADPAALVAVLRGVLAAGPGGPEERLGTV
jgi:acyl carrier protein